MGVAREAGHWMPEVWERCHGEGGGHQGVKATADGHRLHWQRDLHTRLAPETRNGRDSTMRSDCCVNIIIIVTSIVS